MNCGLCNAAPAPSSPAWIHSWASSMTHAKGNIQYPARWRNRCVASNTRLAPTDVAVRLADVSNNSQGLLFECWSECPLKTRESASANFRNVVDSGPG